MALDGIVIANVVFELNNILTGGRIDKLYQPESDEIIIAIRSLGKKYKLLLSANPSNPRMYLSNLQKNNPITAPMFCMVLRKHLSNSKIVSFSQPEFERIIIIDFECFNELGDLCIKKLIIEIMGKHSNIILVDDAYKIIDSIIHVSHDKSSVREILPGKSYVFPPSKDKLNPLCLSFESFSKRLADSHSLKIQNFIWTNYTGISPITASELCYRARVDADLHIEDIKNESLKTIYDSFYNMMSDVSTGKFSSEIILEKNELFDFSAIEMTMFLSHEKLSFSSISETLEYFYVKRDSYLRLRQKTNDLRRVCLSNIERCVRKKDIQNKTINDTKNLHKWKLYGELITANIYLLSKGMQQFVAQNFYNDNEDIIIRLDPDLTPVENAQRYFNKYNKAKRTIAALDIQIKQNDEEIVYLESMIQAIETATDEADIADIREELVEQGLIKKKRLKKGEKRKKSKTLHFISSDNYDIFVGKNNVQNDELTLRVANNSDIWLHTKNIPGSHVIIKTNNSPVPDATIFEAAGIAAFYSKAKNGSNVPVDYTIRKNVKKPNGAKPGMVIYDYYNTVYVTPNEELVTRLSKEN